MTPETRTYLTSILQQALAAAGAGLADGDRLEFDVPGGRAVLSFAADSPLTPCERDIIEVLRRADRKLTRKQIVGDFTRVLGTFWEDLWADSTVAIALASLVRRGILVQHRDRRGYALAEWDARRKAG